MPNSNGNGTAPSRYGQDINVLDTRVLQLERNSRDLSNDLSNVANRFDAALKAMEAAISLRMDALSAKIEERSKIPWPALGVMLSFIVVVGGMAYYPIQNTQSRIEATLLRFDERFVTIKELDTRLSAAAQRRDDFQRQTEARFDRLESDVDGIRKEIVPRAEHQEKWRGADAERAGQQRQIDEIKKSFGETFSLRDALVQMQRRIDALEGQRGQVPRG